MLKTIKRSATNSLELIHSLLFAEEYMHREQMQDEFRGLEAAAFIGMDMGAHYKEYAKRKKKGNPALDLLVFIKVS